MMVRFATHVGKLYRMATVDPGADPAQVETLQLLFGVGTPEYPRKREPNAALKQAELPYLICQLQFREWQVHLQPGLQSGML